MARSAMEELLAAAKDAKLALTAQHIVNPLHVAHCTGCAVLHRLSAAIARAELHSVPIEELVARTAADDDDVQGVPI